MIYGQGNTDLSRRHTRAWQEGENLAKSWMTTPSIDIQSLVVEFQNTFAMFSWNDIGNVVTFTPSCDTRLRFPIKMSSLQARVTVALYPRDLRQDTGH